MRALHPSLVLAACLLIAPACGDDPAPRAADPAPAPAPAAAPKAEPKTEPEAEPRPDGALLRFNKRMERLLEVCAAGTDEEATAEYR